MGSWSSCEKGSGELEIGSRQLFFGIFFGGGVRGVRGGFRAVVGRGQGRYRWSQSSCGRGSGKLW